MLQPLSDGLTILKFFWVYIKQISEFFIYYMKYYSEKLKHFQYYKFCLPSINQTIRKLLIIKLFSNSVAFPKITLSFSVSSLGKDNEKHCILFCFCFSLLAFIRHFETLESGCENAVNDRVMSTDIPEPSFFSAPTLHLTLCMLTPPLASNPSGS